jgi:peptide/nickel transport system substrate-binding protein
VTVAAFAPNTSMDPYAASAGMDVYYLDPVYASLIVLGPGGKLQPGLATSWGYVGTGNKVFELTLRAGVKFSDGTPVTAKAVVESLDYFAKDGTNKQWLGSCTHITAVGSSKVKVTCASANPILPDLFSDWFEAGDIICPSALANPSGISANPCGAGPYTLNTSQTVTGTSYTYNANPHYWDQSAVHYSTLVVKAFSSDSSALEALRSGQVQALYAVDAQIAQTAQGEGLNVSATQLPFQGMLLANRTRGPLKSLKVRQALNYAVNRTAFVEALFGPFGVPTDEAGVPGQSSTYDPAYASYYKYNPAKAKKLLKEAGYPHGLTLNTVTDPQDVNLTQAIAGYWAKIGVKVNIKSDPSETTFISDSESGKYPAVVFGYAGSPMFLEARSFFLPIKNQYNPLGLSDSTEESLLTRAASASGAKQTRLYQKAEDHAIEQGWFVVMDDFDVEQILGPSVSAPALKNGLYVGNAIDVAPKS